MLVVELLLLLAVLTAHSADIDFVSALRSGDRDAFRTLFERYHGDLLRYLRFRNVPSDMAEDLVQQAFVTLWERRETLRDDGSVRGLLFRIAYTRALNYFRDTDRFERLDFEVHDEAGRAALPDENTEGRLVRDRLKTVVQSLPERRRAVFELCVLEGLTYRETADVLEISIKTVENQMSQALRVVREALAEHRPGEG